MRAEIDIGSGRKIFDLLIIVLMVLSAPQFSLSVSSEKLQTIPNYLVINEVYYGDNNSTDSGWWIEIYNPTNRLFNLTALTYLDIDCLSILPPDDPTVLFHPHEYVLFCGSVEKLTASWDIPSGTKITELDYFGRDIVMMITSDDATNEPASGNYYDVMGDGWGEESYHYPLPPSHHSWARYRGGYDTDNFTDDFYDEPNPTPGYENNMAKDGSISSGQLSESTLMLAVSLTVFASVVILVAMVRRKRRVG